MGVPVQFCFPSQKILISSMLLAQRKDFWELVDRAHKEGEKKGFTKLEDLPD